MRPVKEKYLKHSVTLFNLWQDPDTGAMRWYRTFLEHVRIDTHQTSLQDDTVDRRETFALTYIIDPVTTKGYGLDENGTRVDKRAVINPQDWCALPEDERLKAWTLKENDKLMFRPGYVETLGPEFPEDDPEGEGLRDAWGLRVVTSVGAIIDFDGTVHHWEGALV